MTEKESRLGPSIGSVSKGGPERTSRRFLAGRGVDEEHGILSGGRRVA